MSDNDDDNGLFGAAFPIPLPAGLLDGLRQTHDRKHMAAESLAARVETFISGLDVDGLMALRTILNLGDTSESKSANFLDGQCVAILRYVHHVDPDTGKDPLALDEEVPKTE